jgi:glyoxylase-like metal-dependent hydrolase (beta-lactamase superfamily II)
VLTYDNNHLKGILFFFATMLYRVVIKGVIGLINLLVCGLCPLFFESAFGICIGCWLYNRLRPDRAQLCPGGASEYVPEKQAIENRSGTAFGQVLPFEIQRIERLTVNIQLGKRFVLKALLLSPVLVNHVSWASEPVFEPKAQKVADKVYAIVGPLGQRSQANAGLNANYGFVVTDKGVILIDSGASAHSAAMLEKAVKVVTPQPVRWVLNTGSQDHRWLGNDYFASKGAQVHALAATVKTQQATAEQQIAGIRRFIGDQMNGTQPRHADVVHPGTEASLNLAGVQIQWIDTSAHFPGDTMIHLPKASVTFTGDLVYVDRLLGVLPQSSVRKATLAFERLGTMAPVHVVPGHGRVTNMAQAQKETGDYYRYLISNIGAAARNMDPMSETLDKFATPAQFKHLQNFKELHRGNMNRVFVDFESNP